jgi:hypothetical protein
MSYVEPRWFAWVDAAGISRHRTASLAARTVRLEIVMRYARTICSTLRRRTADVGGRTAPIAIEIA